MCRVKIWVILLGFALCCILALPRTSSLQAQEPNLPVDYSGLAWSPTSEYIVFISIHDNIKDVWIIRPDGTDAVNLTDGVSAYNASPVWSPDGNTIAFVSDREQASSDTTDVWITNLDKSEVVNVTSEYDDGRVFTTSSFSPDGTTLAVTAAAIDFENQKLISELWFIDMDDHSVQRIQAPDEVLYIMPRFSPDGKKVAFLSNAPEYGELLVGNFADGKIGIPNLLYSHKTILWGISWSPDSAKIATASFAGSEEIVSVDLETGMDISLTNDDVNFPSNAVWSPDGAYIAFTAADSASYKPTNIWVMGTNGTNPHNISKTVDGRHSVPTWSPDSSKLAFVVRTYDESDNFSGASIWVINADGSEPHSIFP